MFAVYGAEYIGGRAKEEPGGRGDKEEAGGEWGSCVEERSIEVENRRHYHVVSHTNT